MDERSRRISSLCDFGRQTKDKFIEVNGARSIFFATTFAYSFARHGRQIVYLKYPDHSICLFHLLGRLGGQQRLTSLSTRWRERHCATPRTLGRGAEAIARKRFRRYWGGNPTRVTPARSCRGS